MSRKGNKNNQQASQPGQGNGLPPPPDQVRERRKVPPGQVYRRPSRWRKALKWETLRWVLVLLAVAGLAFGYGKFFSGAARSGQAAAEIEAQRGIIDVHEHTQSIDDVPKTLGAMDALGIGKVCLMGSSNFTLTLNPDVGFTGYDENNEQLMQICEK